MSMMVMVGPTVGPTGDSGVPGWWLVPCSGPGPDDPAVSCRVLGLSPQAMKRRNRTVSFGGRSFAMSTAVQGSTRAAATNAAANQPEM